MLVLRRQNCTHSHNIKLIVSYLPSVFVSSPCLWGRHSDWCRIQGEWRVVPKHQHLCQFPHDLSCHMWNACYWSQYLWTENEKKKAILKSSLSLSPFFLFIFLLSLLSISPSLLPIPRGRAVILYAILGAVSTPSMGGGGMEVGWVGGCVDTYSLGHSPFPRSSTSVAAGTGWFTIGPIPEEQ